MTGQQFEHWMKKNKIRVSDVASKTGLDPNTIYSFRRGESVRRTTLDILFRFIQEFQAVPATGGRERTG